MCSRAFDLLVFPSISRCSAAPFTRRYRLRLYIPIPADHSAGIDHNPERFRGSGETPWLENTGALLFLLVAGVQRQQSTADLAFIAPVR
jgi:hypothetical protein